MERRGLGGGPGDQPGKFADLVFLDRDPLTADPQTNKDIEVTRTIVGGRTVYQA